MIKNYTQRVAQTAILDVKGSYAQRTQMAAAKNAEFFAQISDTFEKEKQISVKKFGAILRKFIPNIKLIIKKNQEKDASGCLHFQCPKGVIKGFILELPICAKNKTISASKGFVGMHETRHLFDYALNPKFSAKANESILEKRFPGYMSRVDKYYDFFDKHLYEDERSLSEVQKWDKNPEALVQKRLEKLEKKTRKVFAAPEISSDEKIEIMQAWRYALMTEKNANIDDITYDNKIALGKKMKKSKNSDAAEKLRLDTELDIKQEIRQEVGEEFFFDGKIFVLEKLLKEEIANHRREHAQQLQLNVKIR